MRADEQSEANHDLNNKARISKISSALQVEEKASFLDGY